MNESASVAIANLTSVPVLVFMLGFLAARFKTNVSLPDPVYQVISVYLLLGIGLKGGVALSNVTFEQIFKPAVATIFLGLLIPFLAYLILHNLAKIDRTQSGVVAAHYGSTSLVTFGAAILYLENQNIPFDGFVTTLLTIMEIPGILIGILLAVRQEAIHVSWGESLREIIFGKTSLLLVGGLLVGYLTGDSGYEKVAPFFSTLLNGILALFLLHLGHITGSNWSSVRTMNLRLIGFAFTFPVLAGTIGILLSKAAGLSVGSAVVVGVLSASASYIAAPAAVSIALPNRDNSLAVTMSLALTFPFNLILGIPIYELIAKTLISS